MEEEERSTQRSAAAPGLADGWPDGGGNNKGFRLGNERGKPRELNRGGGDIDHIKAEQSPNSPEPEKAGSGQNAAATRRNPGGEYRRQRHLGEGSINGGEQGEEAEPRRPTRAADAASNGQSKANDDGGHSGDQRCKRVCVRVRGREKERRKREGWVGLRTSIGPTWPTRLDRAIGSNQWAIWPIPFYSPYSFPTKFLSFKR
jgi:hypothetical protein